MIFWILVGLSLLLSVLMYKDEGFKASVGLFFGGLLISFLLVSGVGGILEGAGIGKTEYWAQKETLKALNNGTGVSGQFFLGSGTVGSERQINYISVQGNSNMLKQLPATGSAVIEDTPKEAGPYVVTRCYHWEVDWLAPFISEGVVGGGIVHEFHVPPGSILEGYSIDNSK